MNKQDDSRKEKPPLEREMTIIRKARVSKRRPRRIPEREEDVVTNLALKPLEHRSRAVSQSEGTFTPSRRRKARKARKHVSRQEKGFETAILRPWQELTGRLEQVSFSGSHLEVQIATKNGLVRLSFERDSSECQRIHDSLLSYPIGSLVGFLKTDSKSNTILIRTITE